MTTRHTTKRHEPKTHPDLRCYERFKTLVPAIALRPRQLAAADAQVQTQLAALLQSKPAWMAELMGPGEQTYLRDGLEQQRPLPPFKWPTPYFWDKESLRFESIYTFKDRPSPYAIPAPEPRPPVSMGLPGNWDPALPAGMSTSS